VATATGQKPPLEDMSKVRAGDRPLVGNQLRWAKQVILETAEQLRARRARRS
jgi:hypothetical protein